MKNKGLDIYLLILSTARLPLVITVFLTSCKNNDADDQKGINERGSYEKTSPSATNVVGDPSKITIDHRTDIKIFLEENSSSELVNRLREAFRKSDDRISLAKSILSNYTGYPSTRAAVELSSAMEEWPEDYVAVVLSEVPPSDHERLIGRHLSLHQAKGKRDAVKAIYEALEPGVLRSASCTRLCMMDYKVGGIDKTLQTIESLQFDTEKLDSLIGILSAIGSSQDTLSLSEYSRVEEISKDWQDSKKIKSHLRYLKRIGKVKNNN